jgi:hypothetical protein
VPSRQTSGGSPRDRTETSCFSDRRADQLRKRAIWGFMRTPPRQKQLFGCQRIGFSRSPLGVVRDSHCGEVTPSRAFALPWFGLRDSNPHSRFQRPLSCQLDEARMRSWCRGAAGNRTRVSRLKAGCSTIELQPQNWSCRSVFGWSTFGGRVRNRTKMSPKGTWSTATPGATPVCSP